MTKAFIKFRRLNQQTAEDDSEIYVSVESIIGIQVATAVDRRQRREANSIVITTIGPFASPDAPATIIQRIREAESSVPTTET